MAQAQGSKPIGKTIVYGLMSVALYAAAFSQADTFAALFSQGSLWAAGPIATVFVFSYVHGAFASNLWETLGINAHTVKRPATHPAARPQARATLNA